MWFSKKLRPSTLSPFTPLPKRGTNRPPSPPQLVRSVCPPTPRPRPPPPPTSSPPPPPPPPPTPPPSPPSPVSLRCPNLKPLKQVVEFNKEAGSAPVEEQLAKPILGFEMALTFAAGLCTVGTLIFVSSESYK